MPSSKKLSLKFWLNQLQRTTVHVGAERLHGLLGVLASGSPRPESSTSRRTPSSSASSANAPTVSAAPGTARSG